MNLLRSTAFLALAFGCLSMVGAVPVTKAQGVADIQGAGSTFVAPILKKWSEDYTRISGGKVSYGSVGSAAGITQIESAEVDFGATDKPLSPEELEKNGLCQFPIVIGGVVPVVNIPDVSAGQIKFSGKLLGDIYLGIVTTWNAPEIKALNPSLNLPAMPIAVVHRSDGSGTTYNWADFLSKTNPDWKAKVGEDLSVNWPVGVGGEGNAGVAATVTQTPGSIGYVEFAYAVQNKLAYAQVENGHELFISPSPFTFEAAADTVDWENYKDFSVLLTNAGSPAAYPIAATTFILMYKKPKDAARSAATLAFFKWALEDGEKDAADLHYVALPPRLVRQIKKYWAAEIKSPIAANVN